MDVTEDLVRHVAELARLELTDEEVTALRPQIAAILEHVEGVQELDVDENADPATLAPIDFEDLREDVVGPTLDRRSITENAPKHDGAFLVVPRVFENGAN